MKVIVSAVFFALYPVFFIVTSSIEKIAEAFTHLTNKRALKIKIIWEKEVG